MENNIFHRNIKRRQNVGKLFYIILLLFSLIGLIGLSALLIQILRDGLPYLSTNIIFNYPSRHIDQAGLKSALFGTLWILSLTALISLPIGMGAAIYLEEFAKKNWITNFIEINIGNLAGVPSIVYGLLGLTIFVELLGLGRVVLAGALTMTLLILPIIILSTRESIKAVPNSYREAALALGATKWQMVKRVVLPIAFPGFLTGAILAMSRAIGESAPMIAISALVYITFIPSHAMDRFTVLPIQIFNWISRPQAEFAGLAAAGIIVLLTVLLLMNAVAVYFRNRYQVKSNE
ncbi:MAG: phosphate ABC transporter permease PstA [Dehalococcoidia bacterium]|nr:phosphate ABC transporter, permease protein PstA [Chloroflexota bacterium]MCH2306169.1 phosphate ABC transporter permease PstA [SAR202 cluster bacterium]